MHRMNVVVLFGGQSTEHDISRKSARNILSLIDQEKYNIYPVGITKEGQWLHYQGEIDAITEPDWMGYGTKAVLSPDAVDQCLYIFNETLTAIHVDVVFPALHGPYGEDGTIQGMLELSRIPYVGCGVLSSAVSMDKYFTKIIVEKLGIRQARYLLALREDHDTDAISWEITESFGYPVFIKPCNAGSSIGVSKAKNTDEMKEGLRKAFEYDRKVLIEEEITGRELECAVLGNVSIKASGVGEILPAEEFYDFDAKYNNADSKTIVNTDLPDAVRKQIRESAIVIFKGLEGKGLSRVDFFLDDKTNEVIFNEINTLPGFTDISMYPMLWEEKGIQRKELVDKLLRLAIQGGHHDA